MRISDWSSDVCSSDLVERTGAGVAGGHRPARRPGDFDRDRVGGLLRLRRLGLGVAFSTVLARAHRSHAGHQHDGQQRHCEALKHGVLVHLLRRSEEHTSELQSLMRISYAVFCLKNKTRQLLYDTNNNITY